MDASSLLLLMIEWRTARPRPGEQAVVAPYHLDDL
jgi:hypothetical protein